MSTSRLLPNVEFSNAGHDRDSAVFADQSKVRVVNLAVLVHARRGDRVSARAANLQVPAVEAATIRQALSELVSAAKGVLAETAGPDEIPWINPPLEPHEAESRFLVPLHL